MPFDQIPCVGGPYDSDLILDNGYPYAVWIDKKSSNLVIYKHHGSRKKREWRYVGSFTSLSAVELVIFKRSVALKIGLCVLGLVLGLIFKWLTDRAIDALVL